MTHSRAKLVSDIVMACADIESFTAGHCYDDFVDDRLLQAGIERELEIIGEALNRLHQADSDWLDEIIPEYRRIIGLRNIIAHGYDVVDYDIIWDLAQNHVPGLKKKLESF